MRVIQQLDEASSVLNMANDSGVYPQELYQTQSSCLLHLVCGVAAGEGRGGEGRGGVNERTVECGR